ncbi:FAD-dependent oxidoreductase [Microbacterium invictum]|uniref:2-polyprenyl-6-methoxyphenol hydroxylase-like FAD-dependent oxidoreductase n=1 Tax=Microbacterium invictum TaxID=515415 RepID=A0AA40VLB4_9MICO|nr:FAD-dependent oxidoreductase [Microbacterium invictum]MBB4139231.1 2-polyprenyl-6-methoxyphenol hydroxylase-like FAD-dependent oxidoreductase [Microbacterium invictum]
MGDSSYDVVIAGGGPAGVMLGYLLARAGRRIAVLEKHDDFLRDFRGDTIHPSTLTILGELGLRERFLELPVTRIHTMDAVIAGRRLAFVDFRTLGPPDDFLVFAPQWDFLDFLAREGRALPGFDLRMGTEVEGVVEEDGRVVGVSVSERGQMSVLRAALVVAADGRDSRVRASAGLVPRAAGVPIDVLWFHLPKPAEPPPTTLGYADRGGLVLTIDRGDHYQAGCVIEKDGFGRLRDNGLDAFHEHLARIAPPIAPVVGTLESWDQIKVLSVQIDALERWYRPGVVCIGDAAHAMSPVFGVGVNYAIQDAVALANLLQTAPGPLSEVLARLQSRRLSPALRMQRVQRVAHRGIGALAAGHGIPGVVPVIATGVAPIARRVLSRLVGRGFRPEHVATAIRAGRPRT